METLPTAVVSQVVLVQAGFWGKLETSAYLILRVAQMTGEHASVMVGIFSDVSLSQSHHSWVLLPLYVFALM